MTRRRFAGPAGSDAHRLLALGAALAVSGCGAADTRPKPPELPEEYAKCSIQASQSRPLIVEWPSADRAALESRAKRGLVVVRYTGCEMEVLSQCQVEQSYRYTPVTLQSDRITINDADELYAKVPIGATKLEGELAKTGQLNVDTSIVGTWDVTADVSRDQLAGRCDGATHVLTSLTVGAFRFYSGAEQTTGGGVDAFGVGAGAKRSSSQHILSRSGDPEACRAASTGDESPPEGCSALVRVEATQIAAWKTVAPSPPNPSVEKQPTEEPAPVDADAGVTPQELEATADAGSELPGPQPEAAFPASSQDAPAPREPAPLADAPTEAQLNPEPGSGFVLGLRGPFAVNFGELEPGVQLQDYLNISAGITLEAGARLNPMFVIVGTASLTAGKGSGCPSGVDCSGVIGGFGADLVLTPQPFWIGLGGEYALTRIKRDGEFSDGDLTGHTVQTNRLYRSVGPRVSVGVDAKDEYVAWIQYGFMISYTLRKGLGASGDNTIDGAAVAFGGDGDGVTHTLLFVGHFKFDFGFYVAPNAQARAPSSRF